MATDRLAAIQQRVEKATKGPWALDVEMDGVFAGIATVVRGGALRVVTVGQTRPHHRDAAEANAEFIAHAREDVPYLLAEVQRQGAELTALREAHDTLKAEVTEAIEEMPACRRQHLQGAPLLAIVKETVRHMFWAESRGEQAAAEAAQLRADAEIVAGFIAGWFPGLEDGIYFGEAGPRGDTENNAVLQAARRLLALSAPSVLPSPSQEMKP